MSIFRKRKKRADNPGSAVWYLDSSEAIEKLCNNGYTRLDKIPAVVAGARRIAEAVGSMTIKIMANTDRGDERIQNELSRKIDINPCKNMSRSQFMEYIVMSMLLYGDGNAIAKVVTKGGLLDEFIPVPPSHYVFVPVDNGYSYRIRIDGVEYEPDEVLHFVYNPDKQYPWKGQGVKLSLQSVAETLKQAQETENAFMTSKFMPSMIVKVDAIADQFSTKAGRQKLLDEYIDNSSKGEPWVVPAEQIDVKEIRPLSLSDIALNDSVAQDTKTVAALLGVPAFLLGAGDYNKNEWNNFINAKIRPMVVGIQQEMTRKLIISPKMYIKLNQRGLYDYDLSTLATVYTSLQDRGDVTGNEVRDIFGMSPKEGLDELVRLENYIPADMAGNQSKLTGGNDSNE